MNTPIFLNRKEPINAGTAIQRFEVILTFVLSFSRAVIYRPPMQRIIGSPSIAELACPARRKKALASFTHSGWLGLAIYPD